MSFVVFVGFANTHGGILGDTPKLHSHLQQARKQRQMPIARCRRMGEL
jgi:hypothetical protein